MHSTCLCLTGKNASSKACTSFSHNFNRNILKFTKNGISGKVALNAIDGDFALKFASLHASTLLSCIQQEKGYTPRPEPLS